ncbi:NAD-dependent protein deacetylase sirtuin-2 [Phlyctochytrium planicorne]|nr:NAD-dependent protein deacetylase sirtuin-2 [Phlyctochytrium planicorne]
MAEDDDNDDGSNVLVTIDSSSPPHTTYPSLTSSTPSSALPPPFNINHPPNLHLNSHHPSHNHSHSHSFTSPPLSLFEPINIIIPVPTYTRINVLINRRIPFDWRHPNFNATYNHPDCRGDYACIVDDHVDKSGSDSDDPLYERYWAFADHAVHVERMPTAEVPVHVDGDVDSALENAVDSGQAYVDAGGNGNVDADGNENKDDNGNDGMMMDLDDDDELEKGTLGPEDVDAGKPSITRTAPKKTPIKRTKKRTHKSINPITTPTAPKNRSTFRKPPCTANRKLSKQSPRKSLQQPEQVFGTLDEFAEEFKRRGCKRVLVLTGAGISTAAGIPDFRTPGVGIYDGLIGKGKLKKPEDLFAMDSFRRNPELFFSLIKDVFPSLTDPALTPPLPTVTHHFIRLLAHKNLLLKWYTQNIDGLEDRTGIDMDHVVLSHGTFETASCVGRRLTRHAVKDDYEWRVLEEKGFHACGRVYAGAWVWRRVRRGLLPECRCGGLVKPDVTFFGEDLPGRFWSERGACASADAVVVLGTGLRVAPFNGVVGDVGGGVLRLVVNRERVGADLGVGDGRRDFLWEGECDEGVWRLAGLLGLEAELRDLVEGRGLGGEEVGGTDGEDLRWDSKMGVSGVNRETCSSSRAAMAAVYSLAATAAEDDNDALTRYFVESFTNDAGASVVNGALSVDARVGEKRKAEDDLRELEVRRFFEMEFAADEVAADSGGGRDGRGSRGGRSDGRGGARGGGRAAGREWRGRGGGRERRSDGPLRRELVNGKFRAVL